jgi:hypothetical protein
VSILISTLLFAHTRRVLKVKLLSPGSYSEAKSSGHKNRVFTVTVTKQLTPSGGRQVPQVLVCSTLHCHGALCAVTGRPDEVMRGGEGVEVTSLGG